MHSDAAYHSVALTSGAVALVEGIPEGLVSLGVGLLGVALARWVFVNRETRVTNRQQRWNESFPLTAVAMLITGVLIVDRKFSVSTSAFVGLGVGWTAVLLLDVLGDWILHIAKKVFSAGPVDPNFPKSADHSGEDGYVTSREVDLPPDMEDALKRAERALDDNSLNTKDLRKKGDARHDEQLREQDWGEGGGE